MNNAIKTLDDLLLARFSIRDIKDILTQCEDVYQADIEINEQGIEAFLNENDELEVNHNNVFILIKEHKRKLKFEYVNIMDEAGRVCDTYENITNLDKDISRVKLEEFHTDDEWYDYLDEFEESYYNTNY